ncbi:ABC transporter permease [Halalkalibacter sp. AB-rgal2]|uniref:ABC transporter permease n=1 Tax=Halalkalibacter sp. AB-rgal2 TaxID=3242695 RepID=UPI00359ED1A4
MNTQHSKKRMLTMKKIVLFLKGDIRSTIRDPLMLLVFTIPFLMYMLVTFGLPYIDQQIVQFSHFQLMDHRVFIIAMIMTMVPMMVGMLTGYLLLDEKDDGILQYMEITPLKKAGYIWYRISLPAFLSFMITMVMGCVLLFRESVHWSTFVAAVVVVSLLGPVITMYLASFAQNKVEGIAYTKLINLVMIAPLVPYLFDGWWTWISYVIPLTWGVEAFSVAMNGNGTVNSMNVVFLITGGGAVTLGWLYVLYLKFQRSVH